MYLSVKDMSNYLSRSISSINSNKLRGLLAEIDFRNYLQGLGYGSRVSPGGWIVRSTGDSTFGSHTIAIFPEIILPGNQYPCTNPQLSIPTAALQSVGAALHQSGITSYFCAATIKTPNDAESVEWWFYQLGVPNPGPHQKFPFDIPHFEKRDRRYNFLRYNTDVANIPVIAVPEEFSKENLRVAFQSYYLTEISDIDGIFWGQQFTYPVEIKEKTAAINKQMGEFFGLDAGPFVKLAFYAAKRGNLHSLFVVREITDISTRTLKHWWFISFQDLAQYASWVPQKGGRTMTGGESAVVKIPKSKFKLLNANELAGL